MKPELILHIGLPKTGTTSIQHVFSKNREALLAQSVLFPNSPGRLDHSLLPAAVLGKDLDPRHFWAPIWEGMSPAARIERFRREFVEELTSIPDHVRLVVISAEHCGVFLTTREAVETLAGMLRPYFSGIRILAYLRRQDLYIASIYNQRLRVGQLVQPSLPAGSAKNLFVYNYEALLGLWASVFGESAIQVRIFEKASLLRGDVVDDFIEACGIKLDIAEDDPVRTQNESTSVIGQHLLIALGRRLIETQGEAALQTQVWRRICHISSTALKGRGWRATRGQAQEFMSRFEAGNEAVRRRFLPHRAALFSEGLETLPEQPVSPDTGSLYTATLDLLLAEVQGGLLAQAGKTIQLSNLNRQLGNKAAAKQLLEEAVRLNPDHPGARLGLANELIREGEAAAARVHLAVAQRYQPESGQVKATLARLVRLEAETSKQG
jgi:tetratricopeptide (TPR) repeat protein